jgi:hypothetical protein
MLASLLVPLTVAARLASGSAPALAVSPTVDASREAALPALDATGDRARRLVADILIDADAVDLAAADRRALRFAVERAGAAYRLEITLGDRGRIESATVRRAPRGELGEGALSWLGLAIGDRERVIGAAVGDDGIVVLELDDGTALPLTPEAGDDYVGC